MVNLLREYGYLFCEIEIDDKPLKMLVDTGSNTSNINKQHILNYKTVGEARPSGASGKETGIFEKKEVYHITIGNIIIEKNVFISGVPNLGPIQLDGILGRDILFHKNILLDLEKNQINFISEEFTDGLDFFIHDKGVYFEVEINGKPVNNIIFDTGAGSVSILNAEIAKSLNLPVVEPTDNMPAIVVKDGSGATLECKYHQIDSLKIGDISLQNVNFLSYDLESINEKVGLKQNGIISCQFFGGLKLKFDFKNKKFKIEN